MNPLLSDYILPPFHSITAAHIEPAIEQLIADNLQTIETLLTQQEYTWNKLIWPLEEKENTLNKAWSIVSHINAVANTTSWRQAYNNCLPKLTEYSTQIGQNEQLYSAYLSLKQSKQFTNLSSTQQKVITNALRDFELSGVSLPLEKKAQFAQLNQELAKLQSQFQDNLMDATDQWYYDVKEINELTGLPPAAVTLAKEKAEKSGINGWRLTLDYPCYQAVITYADNRALRQKLHEAYSTRASEIGPHSLEFDNSKLMEQILEKRHQIAKLLGFNNFVEFSLVKKMAKDPQEVMNFLKNLAEKTLPHAKEEFAELKDFAKGKVDELAPWDIAYYSEKLKQSKFSFSQEAIRPYFPLPKVLDGMFEVVHRLYGLKIIEKENIETWHQNVRFFEIYDEANNLRGKFYLDLFARANKRGGAWMDEATVRKRTINGKIQIPIAYLTCNFRPPLANVPALLTHDEMITLFHEFGHGLHHMLTQIECAEVAGINGVPWDVVELPSQFMENWCWENEALAFISGHYQTAKPLAADILQKMQQGKNFQSAMMLLRQLEFSLFDFRLHLEFDEKANIQKTLDEIRAQYSVVPIASYNRFQHSFSHIFAGGYAAGYYSYLWAEVLSADAYSKFEEEGIFNRQTGQAFLHKILEKGGSIDSDQLFRDFRGRNPEIQAFLRHRGLV